MYMKNVDIHPPTDDIYPSTHHYTLTSQCNIIGIVVYTGIVHLF